MGGFSSYLLTQTIKKGSVMDIMEEGCYKLINFDDIIPSWMVYLHFIWHQLSATLYVRVLRFEIVH